MANRETRLLLAIKWNDEIDPHPMAWDVPTMIQGDPFNGPEAISVRVVSFEDVDEKQRPEQV